MTPHTNHTTTIRPLNKSLHPSTHSTCSNMLSVGEGCRHRPRPHRPTALADTHMLTHMLTHHFEAGAVAEMEKIFKKKTGLAFSERNTAAGVGGTHARDPS